MKAVTLSAVVVIGLSCLNGQSTPIGTPRLSYASYFGGEGFDVEPLIAIDDSGNVILAGGTNSPTLPGTENAFQRRHAVGVSGHRDLFIAKFDPTGRRLLWTSYFGGDADEVLVALALDRSGNILITGQSTSTNLPTTAGAFRTSGSRGSFLAKIAPDGRSLLFSTFLDGITPTGLTVNSAGEPVLLGGLGSTRYPNLFESTAPPTMGFGMIIARFHPAGTSILSAREIGTGDLRGTGVALDAQGDVYVYGTNSIGTTRLTPGSYQPEYSNAGLPGQIANTFVLRISRSLDRLMWGTYLGPRFARTFPRTLAVDQSGRVHIAGGTNAADFPVTPNAFRRERGSAFVATLSANGSSLLYASYIPQEAAQSYWLIDPVNSIVHTLEAYSYRAFSLSTAYAVEVIQPMFGYSMAPSQPGQIWIAGLPGGGPRPAATPDGYQQSSAGNWDVGIASIRFSKAGASAIVSAASQQAALACGQLVSLFGSEMGPAAGAVAGLENGQLPTQLAGTRVLIGPEATAAPLLYVGEGQVNTVIPHSVCGQAGVDVVLERDGARISTTRIDLARTAPALFTIGGGVGQVAALNQDGSVNGPANPAARGDAVTLFLTGAGAMTGTVVDGGIAQDASVRVAAPVTALLGSFDSGEVLYAGAAPGLVHGVVQLNVRISTSAPVGPATPIRIRVGDAISPGGATIAIR